MGLIRKISPAVILLILSFCGRSFAAPPLKLGVHPYLGAAEIVEKFTPLAQYLSGRLGRDVVVEISRDYDEHIKLAGEDLVDIAFIGPASYVKLTGKYGKKPIIARLEVDGAPDFRGVIIVSAESGIDSVAQLAGKRFAFGDPNSTMSHYVPRYMLWQAGVGVDRLSGYAFLENHHNVALGVLMGDFDAGAVKEDVFYRYEKRGLKALAWTPAIPEHLFVASSKLPGPVVDELRRLLSGLRDTDEGMAVLRYIKEDVTALTPAEDADYDGLREILRAFEELVARR